jgi:general stress protein YciG
MTTDNDIHSAAQMLGKRGGSSKSEAKVNAARENGKLGGRPSGSKNKKPRHKRTT